MNPGSAVSVIPRFAALLSLVPPVLAGRAAPPATATRTATSDPLVLRLDPGRGPDRTRWPVRLGVRPDAGPGVLLAPDPPDVPEAQLISRPLRTSPDDGPLLLELSARPQPASAHPLLLVELGDALGQHFRTLARLEAGQDTNPLRLRFVPPQDPWRLRIRVPPGGGRWLIQQLRIRRSADDQGTLRIDAMPVRPYQVFAAAGDALPRGLVLPARIAPEPGLKLLAPAHVGSWVFWRWELDGQFQPVRRRVLDLGRRNAWEAVAHYRPGADQVVRLHVDQVPDPAAPPRVLLDGMPLPPADGPTGYALLPGEQVTVETPTRTGRARFDYWEIDGLPIEGAGPRLILPVRGETNLRAVYVLLGDMNGDGRVDRDDVDVFVLALADPQAYARRYPQLDRVARGDFNDDGVLDWADIEHFVEQVLQAQP